MTAHPTPQPSGRTAEEILNKLFEAGYTLGENQWPGDMGTLLTVDQVSRQLFNALQEIVDNCELGGPESGMLFRQDIEGLLREFFNQPEASGKDGGK